MNNHDIEKTMLKAAEICAQSGTKLTEKRKRILMVLLASKTPLSAYEVTDIYNKECEQSMPAMSAYRILDFLVSEELAHKLSSTNKYVACAHITCSHSHEIPQFLICQDCQAVKEIGIKKSIVEELGHQVEAAGYRLMNSQLELDCLCERCVNTA